MPAIPYSYTTYEMLEALVARAVTNIPEDRVLQRDQYTYWAKQVASEIDGLLAASYELPIKEEASPHAYGVLQAANNIGVLYYLHTLLVGKNTLSDVGNPWEKPWEEFKASLAAVPLSLPDDAIELGAVSVATWEARLRAWAEAVSTQYLRDHPITPYDDQETLNKLHADAILSSSGGVARVPANRIDEDIARAIDVPTAADIRLFAGEEITTRLAGLVHGTPNDGDVIKWSRAHTRWEWQPETAGGAGLNHAAVLALIQSTVGPDPASWAEDGQPAPPNAAALAAVQAGVTTNQRDLGALRIETPLGRSNLTQAAPDASAIMPITGQPGQYFLNPANEEGARLRVAITGGIDEEISIPALWAKGRVSPGTQLDDSNSIGIADPNPDNDLVYRFAIGNSQNRLLVAASDTGQIFTVSASDSRFDLRPPARRSSQGSAAQWSWLTDIRDKPDLFSGAYADLTGKPTLFDGDYNSLRNKPAAPPAGLGEAAIKALIADPNNAPPKLQAVNDDVLNGGWRRNDAVQVAPLQASEPTLQQALALNYTRQLPEVSPSPVGTRWVVLRTGRGGDLGAGRPDATKLRFRIGDDNYQALTSHIGESGGNDYWLLRMDNVPEGAIIWGEWYGPTEFGTNIEVQAASIVDLERNTGALLLWNKALHMPAVTAVLSTHVGNFDPFTPAFSISDLNDPDYEHGFFGVEVRLTNVSRSPNSIEFGDLTQQGYASGRVSSAAVRASDVYNAQGGDYGVPACFIPKVIGTVIIGHYVCYIGKNSADNGGVSIVWQPSGNGGSGNNTTDSGFAFITWQRAIER